MDIQWDDLRLFLAVAETGSFSGAARALGVGQPTVSRRVAELEEALGHPLFLRGVQGAQLTASAEQLVPAARRMAEAASEVAQLAGGEAQDPGGLVRVAAPPGVAWDFLTPLAAELHHRQPGLRMEVLASIAYLDLSRGDADLALRARAPNQRDLSVLAEHSAGVGVYVSRSYAERLPAEYTLADLDWVTWAPPFHELAPRPQLEAMIPGFAPAFTSDNYLALVRAVEEGLGAMIFADVRHRFSRQRDLVRLPLALGLEHRAQVFLVSTKSALASARVRAMAEVLIAELEAIEAI